MVVDAGKTAAIVLAFAFGAILVLLCIRRLFKKKKCDDRERLADSSTFRDQRQPREYNLEYLAGRPLPRPGRSSTQNRQQTRVSQGRNLDGPADVNVHITPDPHHNRVDRDMDADIIEATEDQSSHSEPESASVPSTTYGPPGYGLASLSRARSYHGTDVYRRNIEEHPSHHQHVSSPGRRNLAKRGRPPVQQDNHHRRESNSYSRRPRPQEKNDATRTKQGNRQHSDGEPGSQKYELLDTCMFP